MGGNATGEKIKNCSLGEAGQLLQAVSFIRGGFSALEERMRILTSENGNVRDLSLCLGYQDPKEDAKKS